MKKILKIFAAVLLTIAIIVSSVVSYSTAALRGTVLNPNMYSKTLVNIGAYDVAYDAFSQMTLNTTSQLGLPEELQDVPAEVLDDAITKGEFNKLIGEFIGGSIGWILYNHHEQDVPIRYIVTEIETAINENEIIANDESNVADILKLAMTNNLKSFLTPEGYGDSLRNYLHYFLSGGEEEYKNTINYYLDGVAYYIGHNLSMYTWISICAAILLTILLFLLFKNDIKYPATLMQILNSFFATISFLAALGLFFAVPLLSNFGPYQSYAEYLSYVSPLFITLGVVALLAGISYLLLSVIFGILKKNLKRETYESN